MTTTYDVASQASLDQVLTSLDLGQLAAGAYEIDLTAGFALTADPTGINLGSSYSLTINGEGNAISGGTLYRGLFVYAGNVTIENLGIVATKAVGGAGGAGKSGGGGGGAGLGGGLFVAGGGSVTLSNVTFTGDQATGGAGGAASGNSSIGAGGGGGLGGAGGNGQGGGGGIGGAGGASSASGQPGLIPGALGGGKGGGSKGGGGGNSGGGGGGKGGRGSAGGGGGGVGGAASGATGTGGKGGFGGGGGVGVGGGDGGAGGFGGGGGGSFSFGGGGGGLGAGGDIFVQQGGTLAIEGGSLSAGTVNGGAGGTSSKGSSWSGSAGSAFGSGLFIQGSQSVTLDPAAGQSLTIGGVIADQSGSLPTAASQGAGGLVLNGAGSVTLDAANTYTGGTTLDAGTLDLAANGAAGSGAVTFSNTTNNVLAIGSADQPASGTAFANTLDNFAGAATLDLQGLAFVSGSTSATVVNSNTLQVTNGTTTLDFKLTGTVAASYNVGDPPGGTLISADPVCFLAGTRIATPAGAVPVERLRAGDPVCLADGGSAPVRWVGHSTVAARFADRLRVFPVRIRAGALGPNLPHRDLLLSPGHAVRIGEILVHASALVNFTTILREAAMPERFVYWHVELDSHALLLAEGVAAESFLDDWQELPFDNAATRPAPSPDAVELPYPRARAARQVPHHLRTLLAARQAA